MRCHTEQGGHGHQATRNNEASRAVSCLNSDSRYSCPRAPLLPLCPAFVQFTDCSRLVTDKLESVPQLQGEAEQEMVRGVLDSWISTYLHILDIYIFTYPGYLHIH